MEIAHPAGNRPLARRGRTERLPPRPVRCPSRHPLGKRAPKRAGAGLGRPWAWWRRRCWARALGARPWRSPRGPPGRRSRGTTRPRSWRGGRWTSGPSASTRRCARRRRLPSASPRRTTTAEALEKELEKHLPMAYYAWNAVARHQDGWDELSDEMKGGLGPLGGWGRGTNRSWPTPTPAPSEPADAAEEDAKRRLFGCGLLIITSTDAISPNASLL